MAIIFGSLQYISVENLLSNISNGTWGYCQDKYYIRSEITEEMKSDKKRALTFTESGETYVKVLSPLSIYVDSEGIYRLADGNTRVTTLAELFNENPEYLYDDIPFRILDSVWTANDLVRLQVASNDAEAHSTIDTLKRILIDHDAFLAKTRLEKPKISTKQLQGLVKEYLCEQFQKSEMQINNYLRLAKAPEFVQELVASDQMALNTFIVVDGKLDKNLPADEVTKVYSILGELAGESKITEKHVKQYFESSPEGVITEKKVKTPKNPIEPEQFTESSNNTFTKLFSISARSFDDPELKSVASGLVKTSLKTLADMLDILSDDQALSLLDPVKDVLMRALSDTENILERAKVSGVEVSEIASKYSKLDKTVSQVYKAVYEQPVPNTTEEIIVTDEVIATVETPLDDPFE
jgi:hypothetical protein